MKNMVVFLYMMMTSLLIWSDDLKPQKLNPSKINPLENNSKKKGLWGCFFS